MKRKLRWMVLALPVTFLLAGPALAASEAAPYEIDAASSRVTFGVRSTGHSFEGVVGDVRGSIALSPEGYGEGAGGVIEVPVESMKTGISKRDRIMREDALEAASYPLIRFEAAGLEPASRLLPEGQSFPLKVTGDLTIHGVTRRVSVPVEVARSGGEVSLEGSFPVLLQDYDITPPSFLFFRVKDEVRVSFHLKARQGKSLAAGPAAPAEGSR